MQDNTPKTQKLNSQQLILVIFKLFTHKQRIVPVIRRHGGQVDVEQALMADGPRGSGESLGVQDSSLVIFINRHR